MMHPAEIALRGLILGQTIQLGNTLYRWENNHLFWVGQEIDGTTLEPSGVEVLLGAEDILSLAAFIRLCEKLPLDQVAVIAGNNTLLKIAHERGEGRADRLAKSP